MAAGKMIQAVFGGFATVVCLAIATAPRSQLAAQEPKIPAANPQAKPTDGVKAAKPVAGEPVKAKPIAEQIRDILPKPETLLPIPEVAIPDDPPPHEGAMIALPYRVRPPDLISVEFLEALPGRPISGERLVRPDGTISLGFYGDIPVVGLTTVQIKEKVILHMRQFVSDESLGLVANEEALDQIEEKPQNLPDIPKPETELPPVPNDRSSPFEIPKEPITKPDQVPKPKASLDSGLRHTRLIAQKQKKASGLAQDKNEATKTAPAPVSPRLPPDIAEYLRAVQELNAAGVVSYPKGFKETAVAPRDSDRVFVDIASYNSQVYYVLGDVNKPGRLPWTANETVLDALTFAGGLDPNADPKTLRLVRPARGGKPSKVYPIDLAAIEEKGDVTANLQIFPGDRLFVYRSAVVDSTIKLNRDAAWMNTVMNTSLVYAYVVRNLDKLGEVVTDKTSESITVKIGDQSFKIYTDAQPTKIDPARRKAALDAWRELLKKTMKAGGAEEQKLIDEVMKALDK